MSGLLRMVLASLDFIIVTVLVLLVLRVLFRQRVPKGDHLFLEHESPFRPHCVGLCLPPGPPRLPIVGNIFHMPTQQEWVTLAQWAKEYGTPFYYTSKDSTSPLALEIFRRPCLSEWFGAVLHGD